MKILQTAVRATDREPLEETVSRTGSFLDGLTTLYQLQRLFDVDRGTKNNYKNTQADVCRKCNNRALKTSSAKFVEM
jgi:hypothetical protein